MENILLDFLSDYVEEPKVVSYCDLGSIEKQKIPQTWLNILSDEKRKIEKLKKQWATFEGVLSLVYEYICDNLISLDLVFFNDRYHLVYGLKSEYEEEVLYYQASNPKDIQDTDYLKLLPEKLKQFYLFQDGWVYLASGTMGIMPIEEIFRLSEYDWEIEESNEFDSLTVNLESSIAIFSNGMGGYISFDERMGELKSMIWWATEFPTFNIEFWPTLDTWIRLGFDD